MEKVQLSNFQKNPLEFIEAVINLKKPILISDRDKALVEIVPVFSPVRHSWLGCMKKKGNIIGDILSPVEDANNWEVLCK